MLVLYRRDSLTSLDETFDNISVEILVTGFVLPIVGLGVRNGGMQSEHSSAEMPLHQPGNKRENPGPACQQTIWDAWRIGVVGFGLASLAVFGSWAFLGKWFYGTLDELGAYLVWTVMYLGIGCESMKGLIPGAHSRFKFFKIFSISFAVYALLWIVVWMTFKNSTGEWLASIFGSLGMAMLICWAFKNLKEWHKVWIALAISNMTGYFIGSWLHAHIPMPMGAVAWGVAYGFFFGGGIGPAFWIARTGGSSCR